MRSSNYFELTDHVLIRQTKKMTDRGEAEAHKLRPLISTRSSFSDIIFFVTIAWKAIEPSIISLMRTYKKARLIKERRKELKTRLSWLTTMIKETGPELRVTRSDYQPHFVDFALMPEFSQLAEAPSSTHITREDFLELRDRLPFFENRWKDQIGYELASIISNRFRLQSHIEPLILAMTFFDCTSCGRRSMQFPSVIAHECLRSRYWRFREDSDAAYFYEDVALNAWNCRPWSSRHLSASRASERAMQIISACGLDPLKTTRMEIEALDPRLCCKTCSRPQALLIMSWRTAVCFTRNRYLES